MKKKSIIAIICVVLLIAIAAYNINTRTSTSANNTDTNINALNTESSTENEVALETEEPTEQIAENNTEESTELTASDDGIPETTNSEGLTAREAMKISGDYVRSQGYNTDTWTEYALSQGADKTDGEWWIYYYGGATNKTERSYAINQRTGEKIVAGPYTYFYGSFGEDGAAPFLGGDKVFPGDEKPEFEHNMELLAIDLLGW